MQWKLEDTLKQQLIFSDNGNNGGDLLNISAYANHSRKLILHVLSSAYGAHQHSLVCVLWNCWHLLPHPHPQYHQHPHCPSWTPGRHSALPVWAWGLHSLGHCQASESSLVSYHNPCCNSLVQQPQLCDAACPDITYTTDQVLKSITNLSGLFTKQGKPFRWP